MDATIGTLLQKKCRVAAERNTPKNIERRAAFLKEIAAISVDKLCFLDESGFSLNLYRAYGWSAKSERCYQYVPFNRGTNRSVIGAFTLSGMVACQSLLGAVRRDRFESFLRHHVLPAVVPGTVLVLDNARIHHGGDIKEIVSAFGCSVLYLPPYSPDFSPIELAWSYVKHIVRGVGPREDHLREEAIERAVALIPISHAIAWFRKCGYDQS